MFEHLQAGDHVELPGHFLGHLLGGDLPVVDGDAGFARRRATMSGASPMSMPVTLAPRWAMVR